MLLMILLGFNPWLRLLLLPPLANSLVLLFIILLIVIVMMDIFLGITSE